MRWFSLPAVSRARATSRARRSSLSAAARRRRGAGRVGWAGQGRAQLEQAAPWQGCRCMAEPCTRSTMITPSHRRHPSSRGSPGGAGLMTARALVRRRAMVAMWPRTRSDSTSCRKQQTVVGRGEAKGWRPHGRRGSKPGRRACVQAERRVAALHNSTRPLGLPGLRPPPPPPPHTHTPARQSALCCSCGQSGPGGSRCAQHPQSSAQPAPHTKGARLQVGRQRGTQKPACGVSLPHTRHEPRARPLLPQGASADSCQRLADLAHRRQRSTRQGHAARRSVCCFSTGDAPGRSR